MSRLLRFLLGHALVGIVAGWACLAGLVSLDVGGLRGLIVDGEHAAAALALLAMGFGVTFGSVAMGAAVMTIGGGDDAGGRPAVRPRLSILRLGAVLARRQR